MKLLNFNHIDALFYLVTDKLTTESKWNLVKKAFYIVFQITRKSGKRDISDTQYHMILMYTILVWLLVSSFIIAFLLSVEKMSNPNMITVLAYMEFEQLEKIMMEMWRRRKMSEAIGIENKIYIWKKRFLISTFLVFSKHHGNPCVLISLSFLQTRQSKQCGFSIYTFDNLKSKSMGRLVRAENMVLSGLIVARKIARMILIQNI